MSAHVNVKYLAQVTAAFQCELIRVVIITVHLMSSLIYVYSFVFEYICAQHVQVDHLRQTQKCIHFKSHEGAISLIISVHTSCCYRFIYHQLKLSNMSLVIENNYDNTQNTMSLQTMQTRA